MDNVAFHKMTTIREIIQSSGHRILFLLPYSPQLNPIENVFYMWKNLIKSANCDTQENILNAMRTSSTRITESDCENYFSNMMTYIGKAFNDKDF
jgi:transposase